MPFQIKICCPPWTVFILLDKAVYYWKMIDKSLLTQYVTKCVCIYSTYAVKPGLGHSGWKERLLGWWVSDLKIFGINQWVGTSLAARRQILTFVAHFGCFRAKKWPNSTFWGPILKVLVSVIFFAFLTPPRANMDGNTMLYALVGLIWPKNVPNCQIWQKR